MNHYQLRVKNKYLNLYNKPDTHEIIIDVHGDRSGCLRSLQSSYEELQEDLAEDGTETMEFISIVEVIKDSL